MAPSGIFIGGAKEVGVWGGAPENFSLTTPSTLAINAEIKINKRLVSLIFTIESGETLIAEL